MKGSKLQGYSRFRTFGNYIYDALFTVACGYKVYDLGSGLNMYKTEILRDGFYMKYKDGLVFNCFLLLGSAYYGYKVRFFPIAWREDDQVSNVKMASQAMTTLKIVSSYVLDKKKFAAEEHRDKIIKDYTAQMVWSNK